MFLIYVAGLSGTPQQPPTVEIATRPPKSQFPSNQGGNNPGGNNPGGTPGGNKPTKKPGANATSNELFSEPTTDKASAMLFIVSFVIIQVLRFLE